MNNSKSNPVETEHFNNERDVSRRSDLTAFCLDLYAGTIADKAIPDGLDRLRVFRDGELIIGADGTGRPAESDEELPAIDGEGIFRRRFSAGISGHDTGGFVATKLGLDFDGRELSAIIKSNNDSAFGPLAENRDHLILGSVKRLFAAIASSRTIQRALNDTSRFHYLLDEDSKIIWSHFPKNLTDNKEIIGLTLSAGQMLERLIDSTRPESGMPPNDQIKIAHLNLLDRPCRLVSFIPPSSTDDASIRIEGIFVERLVHKLRGKLGAILTAAEQLDMCGSRMTENENSQMIGIIDRAAQQIGTIVDRFEQYAGPSDPQMKKLELVDWIKNLTAVKAEENNPIRFNSRVRSVEIVIDQNSLRAALSELIDNALEAGATTSPVEISLDCDGDTPIIAITNALPSEPGVKPILSNNITEPFLSTKSDRAGLGLTIAQKAINDVGGRLEVEFSSGDHFAAKLILPSNINGDK